MPRTVTDEEIAANADQWGKMMHAAVNRDPSTIGEVGFCLVIFRTAQDGGAVGLSWSGGQDRVTGRERVARVLKRVRDRILQGKFTPMGADA